MRTTILLSILTLTACSETSELTEVLPDDTSEAPVKRLIEALREAKRAGPNGLYFHDGSAPMPLEVPPVDAEETEPSAAMMNFTPTLPAKPGVCWSSRW